MFRKASLVIVSEFLLNMDESTRAIVVDYLKYRLDSCGYSWDNDGRQSNITPNPVQSAMRRLGDDFEERYNSRFVDMIQKLNITSDNASDTFTAIMDEIFTDGVNWGRVIALFGFSGRFAVYCFEHDMDEMVDHIVELVTAYVDNTLRDWMLNHNNWQGFMEFQAVQPESEKDIQWPSFKRFFGIAVAGLGFLTLGAFLTQRS
uniref:Apoptosis regulator Bcl-2 family BH4 domain-containing protein n=1 Tax=Arion vulgaris TaxID=1028688 RepID=A0A0B7AMK5_9EUPU